MKNLQTELIHWYQDNHREFPWRKDCHPYHVWISEIMLQQTTTEAVIPYYNRFIDKLPSIEVLANSPLEDVYKQWEGLGYYRRAKHIHETAQVIYKDYQGIFPKDYQTILSLKGIGEYTAGAICSIAYHQETPAVDGNVLRIMARVYLLKDNIALLPTQKKVFQIVQGLIKGYDASSFNQGLMDLGATVCRPKNPRCHLCPISKFCKALKLHQQNVLPIRIKKIHHQELNYVTGIVTFKDKIVLLKNDTGLLENLYGLPQYEIESPYTFLEIFENQYQTDIQISSFIKEIKHVFTHRTWHMHAYHFILDREVEHMYPLDQIKELPISTAHQKVLKSFINELS